MPGVRVETLVYGTRNARQYTRPDICVGAAHPQLPGVWEVGGVSQHRTSWGGVLARARRARATLSFLSSMHASACDHHFLKKCARRAPPPRARPIRSRVSCELEYVDLSFPCETSVSPVHLWHLITTLTYRLARTDRDEAMQIILQNYF